MVAKTVLLLILQLLSLLAAQQQCHVPGQCMGVMVRFSSTYQYNDCLDLCSSNVNCLFFTHLDDTDQCIEYSDCPLIDSDACNNCYSGESECSREGAICNTPGVCAGGHFVAADKALSVEYCLYLCKRNSDCGWYSYSPDTKDCILTEDCPTLDDTCQTCLVGQTDCPTLGANILFVVGGAPQEANYKVEAIYLNGKNESRCPKLADFEYAQHGSFGTFIDDQVFVCGGTDNSVGFNSARCYNYDPLRDLWLLSEYRMGTSRSNAAAVRLSEDKWWVTGGSGGDSSSGVTSTTEIYTVGQGFAPFIQLPQEMNKHNLVKINDTHVMLIGSRLGIYSNKTWMYNAHMEWESWAVLPDLPVAISETHAGLVIHADGTKEVVVAAGSGTNATQIFSLESMKWRLGEDFPKGPLTGATVVPHANTFLLVGGYLYNSGLPGWKDYIHVYDPANERWVELQQKLELPRYNGFAAMMVPDGFLGCS